MDENSVASRNRFFGVPVRFRTGFGTQNEANLEPNLGPKRNVRYNGQHAENTIKTNVFSKISVVDPTENRSKIDPKPDRETK